MDSPEEIRIDKLRITAFDTNSNEDKAAYYLAVSKWFQDRHYRHMDQERDIAEFMRRLGPHWFLKQNWFPASQQEK